MKKFFIILAALLGLSSVLVFQNCGQTKSGLGVNVGLDTADGGGTSTNSLKSVRYYSGGGFPGPNGPLFKDFTILFHNSQSAVLNVVNGEGECNSSKTITASQINSTIDLLNSLQYRVKTENTILRADGGETYVELRYNDRPEVLKLYIDAIEAPIGVYEIVKNAIEINNFLLGLYNSDGFVESCFTADWDKTPVIRYFRGGWFGPPGQQNWSHDYVLNAKTGQLSSKVRDPLCGASRTLSANELNAIKTIIASKNVSQKSSNEPQMADGAYEYIEFQSTVSSVDKTRVHIQRAMASPGNLAYDGSVTDLSNAMKSLVDNQQLAVYCQ